MKYFQLNFFKKSFFSFVIKIINTLLIFITGVFLARNLGSENYGIYSLIMSITTLVAIPITAGLPNFFVREVSSMIARRSFSDIYIVFSLYFKFLMMYFVLTVGSIVFFKYFNSEVYEYFSSQIVLVLPFFPLLMSILLVQCASLRGMGNVIVGQIPFSIISPFVFLVLLFILYSNNLFDYENVVIFKFISLVVSLFAGSYFLIKKIRNFKNKKGSDYRVNYKSLLFLTLIGGFQILLENIDLIIIGIFRDLGEVGVYRVCVQMGSIVSFGLVSINQILHPEIAKLYAQKNLFELQRTINFSSKIILSIGLFFVFLYIMFGKFILISIFGSEYSEGYLILVIISIAQLINSAFGSVGAILNMTGNEIYTLKGMMISLIMNAFLNILLIPNYGMIGAAISLTFSYLIWNMMLRYYVKKIVFIETCCFLKNGEYI